MSLDSPLVVSAIIALVSVPLILGVVPPNRWYGMRTPKTLADRALWFSANRFAGWAFLVPAGAGAAVSVLAPELAADYRALVVIVPVGIALAVSVAYVRRHENDGTRDR